MGLFDAFTGDSAKDAAAKNAALYQQYGTQANQYLDTGLSNELPNLDQAISAYTPLSNLGTKYGGATDLYLSSLGVNGAAGNTAATNAFQASPGYAWGRDQAIEATARNANRFGAGGNELAAVTDRASNLANQEYGNWQTKLAGFVNPEQSSVSGAAAGQAAGYGAKAGAYATDAQNRVGVAGNVAGGTANSNTAAANAQMQASGNFWNGLMSLGGNVAKGAIASERAFKTDIVCVGIDPRGFGRYNFRYLWDEPGVRRRGCMVDEVERVRPDVVRRNSAGIAGIDYGALED